MVRRQNPRLIYLIGFSGSGKSTVGPLLAGLLGCAFIDVDMRIEKRLHCTIPELFARFGERRFRREESRMMGELADSKKRAVIALGGGAFAGEANRKLARRSGIVIYLSCETRILYRRLCLTNDRPMLSAAPKAGETERQSRIRRIKELMAIRKQGYASAHLRLSTSKLSPEQSAFRLYELIVDNYADHFC